MCGVLGAIGPNITNVSDATVARSLRTLCSRGPDGSHSIRFPGGMVSQTRLAIIDLSTGDQPMTDTETGNILVFNGEIYNYRELRAELQRKGYVFRTESDTEVILKAYEEFGTEYVKHLDGMFAIALWDKKKQRLFLARDRFGKKPLYYVIEKGTIYFASEVKAILELGITRPISRAALNYYLSLMYVPSWMSAYEGVEQIPPAHSAEFSNGVITVNRYWDIPYTPLTEKDISYEEAKSEVGRLLGLAVRKRMLAADVEVGALLSGGVDSTFVSLLAQESMSQPLKTFSLDYGGKVSEKKYAEQAALAIGSEHFTQLVRGTDTEELEKVIAYFDEPHGDTSDFPQHKISELAGSKVKVALSGDGADELFMGYGWYTRHKHLSWKAHTYEKAFLNPFQGYRKATEIFTHSERSDLWKGAQPVLRDPFIPNDAYGQRSSFDSINYYDLTTYLPGQLLSKIDRTGMMHSLEVRSPFLDTALAEFVVNLPTTYKSNRTEYKIILKDLLAERMPHDFVYRRKQGFGAPIAEWLRTPGMSTYITNLFSDNNQISNFLEISMVNKKVERFYNKKDDAGAMQLWLLLCLEIWLRKHSLDV